MAVTPPGHFDKNGQTQASSEFALVSDLLTHYLMVVCFVYFTFNFSESS